MSAPSVKRTARSLTLGTGVIALVMLVGCGMKVFLFSAVRGVVTQNGSPVAHAEVERTYEWGWMSRKDSDKTRTDAQGRFSFDPATSSSLLHSVLPMQPTVLQNIHIRVDGKAYRAWFAMKSNFDDLGEIGHPLELTCELTAPDKNHRTHSGIGVLPPGLAANEDEP